MLEIDDYTLTNREKKLAPRRKKHYCNHCDASMVACGGKCKFCGQKDKPRRLKK